MFSIEARANMDGCCMCCGDTPSVSCPMTLHTSYYTAPTLPPAPEGWNPTMVPLVNVQYD